MTNCEQAGKRSASDSDAARTATRRAYRRGDSKGESPFGLISASSDPTPRRPGGRAASEANWCRGRRPPVLGSAGGKAVRAQWRHRLRARAASCGIGVRGTSQHTDYHRSLLREQSVEERHAGLPQEERRGSSGGQRVTAFYQPARFLPACSERVTSFTRLHRRLTRPRDRRLVNAQGLGGRRACYRC